VDNFVILINLKLKIMNFLFVINKLSLLFLIKL